MLQGMKAVVGNNNPALVAFNEEETEENSELEDEDNINADQVTIPIIFDTTNLSK